MATEIPGAASRQPCYRERRRGKNTDLVKTADTTVMMIDVFQGNIGGAEITSLLRLSCKAYRLPATAWRRL